MNYVHPVILFSVSILFSVGMARGRIRFTLGEKMRIVKQAYTAPGNIKPTAREYQIQPAQIRTWKKALESLPQEDLARFVNRKPKIQVLLPGVYDHLVEYFDQMRSLDRPVSVQMLCREAKRYGYCSLLYFIDIAADSMLIFQLLNPKRLANGYTVLLLVRRSSIVGGRMWLKTLAIARP
jgi:hypothetical protein